MFSLADFDSRLNDAMLNAEGIAKLLQFPIIVPKQFDQLRRRRSYLIHSIEQLGRAAAPLLEETLWGSDLKYSLGVFKDDVERAADLATTKYEKVQRCVEALGPGQSAEALDRWAQACQEADVASRVHCQQITESLRLARLEADKARAAFEQRVEGGETAPLKPPPTNIPASAEQKDPPLAQQPPRLSPRQETILEAVIENPNFTGEALAPKAGYPYNSAFKKDLSTLVKLRYLQPGSPGYLALKSLPGDPAFTRGQ